MVGVVGVAGGWCGRVPRKPTVSPGRKSCSVWECVGRPVRTLSGNVIVGNGNNRGGPVGCQPTAVVGVYLQCGPGVVWCVCGVVVTMPPQPCGAWWGVVVVVCGGVVVWHRGQVWWCGVGKMLCRWGGGCGP